MQNQGKSVFDLDANVAAMLCYVANVICCLGFIFSIITVIQDKTNKLARFHAWQSILLYIGPLVLGIVYMICVFVGMAIDAMIGIPIFSMILMLVYFVILIVGLACFVGMIISAIKAYNGEIFKLPIIGNLADKYSN
jgi:uncharacterized membrane protein